MSTVPRRIEVVRYPDGTAEVYIDGDLLPHAIATTEPVTVNVDRGQPPQVRLTLLAHTVSVTDELFADDDLNHPADQPADQPEREASS